MWWIRDDCSALCILRLCSLPKKLIFKACTKAWWTLIVSDWVEGFEFILILFNFCHVRTSQYINLGFPPDIKILEHPIEFGSCYFEVGR